jgi:tRNA(Ile)-lysidine synthase
MARNLPPITAVLTRLVPKSARLLVCVSGGRDSVVLLHALSTIQRLCNIHIEVAHIDHGLRSCSAEDASFVEALANTDPPLQFHLARLGAKPAGENTESWARSERYRTFEQIREQQGLDWILTAHNANDVAETLLMRLLANKETSSIDAVDLRRRCLRPLLSVPREQIEQYITEHGISYREDPTNRDTAYTRNRVRHVLLPLLEAEFDPSIVRSLSERAGALAADDDLLGVMATNEANRIGALSERDLAWSNGVRVALLALHEALRWRVVEQMLLPLISFPVGRRKAQPVVRLFLGEERRVDLGLGWNIVSDRTGITLSRVVTR